MSNIQRKVHAEPGEDKRDLWQRFKNGSDQAFEEIYNTYIDGLYSYGMQIIHNQDLVEDTIQELFVNIWSRRSNLGEVTSIKGYLLKSLRREIIRNLRKERRLISEDQLLQSHAYPPGESILDIMIRDLEEEEKVKKLRTAMQSFSKREMEIIHLRFFQGLPYEGIAELLDLNLKYVYNTASRAYQKFRDHFSW